MTRNRSRSRTPSATSSPTGTPSPWSRTSRSRAVPPSIKVGTKVRGIRLVNGVGDHDIDCKVDGVGPHAAQVQRRQEDLTEDMTAGTAETGAVRRRRRDRRRPGGALGRLPPAAPRLRPGRDRPGAGTAARRPRTLHRARRRGRPRRGLAAPLEEPADGHRERHQRPARHPAAGRRPGGGQLELPDPLLRRLRAANSALAIERPVKVRVRRAGRTTTPPGGCGSPPPAATGPPGPSSTQPAPGPGRSGPSTRARPPSAAGSCTSRTTSPPRNSAGST